MKISKYITRLNLYNKLFRAKKYFFYSALLFTMISYLAHLAGYQDVSRIGIIVSLITCFIGCIVSACGYRYVRRETALQMLGVYFVFTLLWDLALLSPASDKRHLVIVGLGGITLNLSTLIWTLIAFRGKKISNIYKWIKDNILLLLVIGIFIILSIEVINDWIKVDSYSYYMYIKKAKAWDFTFETFRLLQYCAHNSFGYSMLSLIGEYLWPDNGYGVRIIHIIMACITIGAFSKTIEKLQFDFKKKHENFLITALFAFMPLYMGLIYEINLDFPATCFFVWFLYSHINRKKVFEVASVFLLVFSKETGIILLFGFALGWFISTVFLAIRIRVSKDTLINI